MLEGSVLLLSLSFYLYSNVAAKGGGDFNKLNAFEMLENEISFKPEILDEKKLKLEDEEEKEHEEEEEEEEFSFSCMNPDGSPISADVVFVNSRSGRYFRYLTNIFCSKVVMTDI